MKSRVQALATCAISSPDPPATEELELELALASALARIVEWAV